ncbi:beta-ketoacyl synthase [Xenorhabdus thuongxuanensis]|uniref:3-oxoacyl-acyl-carrier protein synthase I/II n=1 Tax=Xenorhabdus thuongxuanensis TaxID=1873484 RepID=A0A1Q5TTK9_9GAMM|nr:beta-ketoacyl synthase [Xenorhabdus thuongxuanensis]OKP03567.1 3-oxoacyl-acyl-carrier protein synthase I/II [Xenorhabdus thuongxuanensis]
MSKLPVITAFGGYGPAGRSSSYHAFRRMVIDSLHEEQQQETILSLALLMGLLKYDHNGYYYLHEERLSAAQAAAEIKEAALEGSLIRKITQDYFDVDAIASHAKLSMVANAGAFSFDISTRQIPNPLPQGWSVTPLTDDRIRITVQGEMDCKIDATLRTEAQAAGQLPQGFRPGDHYSSQFHPRALQMAIVGASDAINSLGIPWDEIRTQVAPDQLGVYSGNIIGQLDDQGFGGMLQSRLKGGRVSAKQCPLGLNSMCADFLNAYVLGSVGHTSATLGACATFLYNLNAAVEDIKAGRIRVAIVGSAEAPILPEVIEGFDAMGALATESKLKRIDESDVADWRNSSRPFGNSCGFVIAESSQYIVLMDDELAVQMGAEIHGSVSDVFINADGYKRSIASPGPGNYITMAKAVASAVTMVGLESVQKASFIQAHGSSTPKNCVTEADIFNRVAEAFSISEWPVTAVKSYLGHSLGSASGDQLISCLGTFKYGILPGIKSVSQISSQVNDARLLIPTQDLSLPQEQAQVAFINSKGFGGNNATGVVYSPQLTAQWLCKRHGEQAFADYQQRNQQVKERMTAYDTAASRGELNVIYKFGPHNVNGDEIKIDMNGITMPGFEQPIHYSKTKQFIDF